MTLRVYDTQRAKKVEFKPVHEGKVGIYFCGMTVQDKPHMGHMLAFVAGDMIRRYLEYKGYQVSYIQNFTDIDDKIIDKASKEGVGYREVAERNMKAYFDAANALHIKPATKYPLATEHIKEILDLIRKLVDRGHAYEAGGDVYFRIRTFSSYGKLSKRKIDDLISGARIAVGEHKEDPLDFALWKASKPHEPSWESPWGPGRPGWHIECSAMSHKHLGVPFDIHGGGEDLIFPHHENEIAQAEAGYGTEFARYWMHNGFVKINAEKMSKSLGNVTNLVDLLKRYDGSALRFFILGTHYRSPIDFAPERLDEAKAGLERIYNALDEAARIVWGSKVDAPISPAAADGEARFREAMDNDFNTAAARAVIFEMVTEINKLVQAVGAHEHSELFSLTQMTKKLLAVLGLPERRSFVTPLGAGFTFDPREITELVEKRQAARAKKDFAEADRIRKELAARGVEIRDLPGGKVEVKRR